MKCLRRLWRPKITRIDVAVFRGYYRGTVLQPLLAVKTPTTGGPLSLNDIIAFESELPSLVTQETVPERRVEELIDRAARVLREVNNVLESDAEQQQRQQSGATASSLGAAQTGQNGAAGSSEATHGSASPLSRSLFGGSAQVSELKASITRQALQKTLEAASVDRPPTADSNGGDGGAGVSAAGGAGGDPGELQERPAWAQALFSSTSASTTASAASAASASRSSSNRSSSSSSSSPSSATAAAAGQRPMGAKYQPPSSSPSAPPPAGPKASGAAGWPSAPSSSSRPSLAPPPPPKLQPAAAPSRRLAAWAPLAYAEVDLSLPTELMLKSEDSLLAEESVLPPLQSVVDLTAAVRPPTRGLDLDVGTGAAAAEPQQQALSAAVAVSEAEVVQGGALGRRLQDGAGRLADGTRFEKLSGTDTGPDGYVKKWEVLRGVTGDGQVQWEECWWQASNRYGLRELGAFKKGTTESGAAWVEEWKEVLYTHPTNLRLVIERSAHKWARDENADEWEEKWGECFEEAGRVHKWADKWAKAGSNVWHERWGEDYDGGGACQKWTDKWAERLLPDGGQEQWGDKWTETFGHGKGTKHGEAWSSSGGGSRYNRWWNEEHFGDGRVRKWGNSTSGEYWDTVEHMDTYYNPVPHFGFRHAVGHSPQLWAVPLPSPEEGDGGSGDDDGLGVGLGRL